MTAVRRMAYIGTLRDETLLRVAENGRPLSRAKAYTARDPSAMREFAQTMAMIAIMDARVDEPAMLPVEL